MPALVLDSVSKSFGINPLLDEVSFSLEDHAKMGVIGPNGSGKTTLLRIVAGQEPADSGRVMIPSALRVGYLPQVPVFTEHHSVLDAVFAGDTPAMRLLHDYEQALQRLESSDGSDERLLARVTDLSHKIDVAHAWDLETNARAVLDRLGITETDAVVSTLSGGQRKRVALARALVERPDLLILDEPTNHLDADTIAWLEAYLERYSGALLLVTHDRYFLDRVTTDMLELDRGSAQRFSGNYTAYLETKVQQTAVQEAEQQKRDNLARRELAWLRRGAKARTTKQKARVDRANELLSAPREEAKREIEISAAASRLGTKVIELERVSKSFDDQPLIADFTYGFTRDDRVGIIGPNGSGKTTLLELITGRLKPDSGSIQIGSTVTIGYYDQESRALNDELRLIDYIEEVAENVRTADGSIITASQMLERFLFPPKQQYTPVGLLSGGERRRLYLLRVLMGAPNVLLLDEPTNDLDIPTLVALEDYLETFPGCVIAVSHDRYFLDRTVEHLFRFEENGHIREIPGNYSAFLEIQAREEAERARGSSPRPTVATPAPEAAAPSNGVAQRKLSYKEKRELGEIEARIARAEDRKAEIEAELIANAADFETVSALSTELESLLQRLDADMERWAELAELVE